MIKNVHTIVRNVPLPHSHLIVVTAYLALTTLTYQADAAAATTYQSTLNMIDNTIKASRQRVERNPPSWLNLEWLANAYLERAKLTGQFEHYTQADAAMKLAAKLSNSPRNAALSRASMNYTLHRLQEVEIDLKQAEKALLVNAPTQRRIDALRADVALQQGRYNDALITYEVLDKQKPNTESAFRLANFYWQISDESAFEQWMIAARDRVIGEAPRVHAWLNLQLGIADLSRGRYDEALAHYNKARTQFPGYWLIEEHIAEIDVIQGRLSLAETKYRDLIDRTDSPMFRIALAEVLQLMSVEESPEEALLLIQKATDQLSNMLELIPESMAGHALEVSLQLEDPEKALLLAVHNHEIRPNGESAVLLAQAYTVMGEVSKAQDILQSVLASPYRSPNLFATASVVFEINGQPEQAQRYSKKALALKHDAMDDVKWLVY